MTAGKIFLTSLLALVLAIGASSTACARSGYSFRINTGAPVIAGYGYGYPAYYAPPPPAILPVAYPYPHYEPVYPVAYSTGPDFSFGFSNH